MITACLPAAKAITFRLAFAQPSSVQSQSQSPSQSQTLSSSSSSSPTYPMLSVGPSALWGKINIKMEASDALQCKDPTDTPDRTRATASALWLTPVSARPKDISNLFTLRGTLSDSLPPRLPLTSISLFTLRMTVFVWQVRERDRQREKKRDRETRLVFSFFYAFHRVSFTFWQQNVPSGCVNVKSVERCENENLLLTAKIYALHFSSPSHSPSPSPFCFLDTT